MRVRLLLAALAASLILTAVASAAALPSGFVGYRSVAGIAPGMAEKTVRARLGVPSSTNKGDGRGISQLIYGRRSPVANLIITFDPQRRGDPVTRIQAGSNAPAFRTRSGVGTGSSLSAVRHAFPGLRCAHAVCTGRRGAVTMSVAFYRSRADLITLFDPRY